MTLLLRLLVLLALLGVAAPPVHAEEVVLLSEHTRAPEHAAALSVALHGYGIGIRRESVPAAGSPLGRAAQAQETLRALGVASVLWIEPEPPARVRALNTTGDRPFEAPLSVPFDTMEPSVFASIATSVVLEALGRTPSVPTPVTSPRDVPAWSRTSEPTKHEVSNLTPPPAPRQPRFFLRAGGAFSLAFVRNGAHVFAPPSDITTRAIDAAAGLQGASRTEAIASHAAAQGYDCNVHELGDSAVSFSECRAHLEASGFSLAPGLDVALGMHITPRIALSLTGRVGLRQPRDIFGLQTEITLTRPALRGFWLALALGAGFGAVTVNAPARSRASTSMQVTSGLGNVRTGLIAGYRFHPNVGFTFGLLMQYMFPRGLAMLDPTLGLEVRI